MGDRYVRCAIFQGQLEDLCNYYYPEDWSMTLAYSNFSGALFHFGGQDAAYNGELQNGNPPHDPPLICRQRSRHHLRTIPRSTSGQRALFVINSHLMGTDY